MTSPFFYASTLRHTFWDSIHTHSKEQFYNDTPFMYNVSLDAHDNRPVSIEQVLAEVKERYATYVRSLNAK